ncbi:Permease of the drug/metabolite transporter (DMT) superfamily [Collimonas arenae]|uniref:Permease of the drug/metabolite transporter (DMT) superfamily n=1 Tax=Collimonas arenae TaxID=279058 RepID=A0A0A1FH16_9BURK|nr:DMT family transporter [Collimonas arenae]AIY44083.1 Permease of the drug/metabolite transporter (DMT) superfamily [Collimonas arenae]
MLKPRVMGIAWRRNVAVFVLIWIAATWGLMFAPIKIAVGEIPVAGFLLLRLAYALCFLIPLVLWQRCKRPSSPISSNNDLTKWLYGIGAGVVLFLIYYLQTAGLVETTSGTAGFITGLTVVFIPLITSVLERKWPSPILCAIALLATIGLVIASVDSQKDTELFRIGKGEVLLFVGAFFNALHIVIMAEGVRRIKGPSFITIQVFICAMLAYFILPTDLTSILLYSPTIHAIAFFCGFYVIGLLLVIQTWAQRQVTPFVVGMLFNLEPLFAVAGGALILGEVTSRHQVLGFSIMLAAIMWAHFLGSEHPVSEKKIPA